MSFQNFISSSCVATVFLVCYVTLACFNLYGLMYPLTFVDLATFPPETFIKPFWQVEEPMHMKVYLSTKPSFHLDFVTSTMTTTEDSDGNNNDNTDNNNRHTALLWQEDIDTTSLSKTFLITKCNDSNQKQQKAQKSIDDDDNNNNDSSSLTICGYDQDQGASWKQAIDWLDQVEESMADTSNGSGGILSTISAAGQGIESTSILLTLYEKISKQLYSLFGGSGDNNNNNNSNNGILERSTIHLPPSSPLWSALMSNSTVYVHVVVVRQQFQKKNPNASVEQVLTGLNQASRSNSLLLGQVNLIKYDVPTHIPKPARFLYKDLEYLIKRYILLQQQDTIHAPWDMQYSKTQQFSNYQMALQMKEQNIGYPYWKPEVSVKFLMDEDSYPIDIAHVSGMEFVRVAKTMTHPSGIAHIPALYVDEIGLTSEKYIPINETISSLPLHITFDRSDIKDEQQQQRKKAATATAGGISPARWRLLSHLSHSIESQKELGFEQSDIDDLRRLIADTNVTLLGITVLASALHLLFEFLTFKNEVSFWKNNTDLTGLSVRSLFLDMIGQIIIVLFLIEKDSSLLMIVPSAIGCLIAAWKCQRAAGLCFVKVPKKSSSGQKDEEETTKKNSTTASNSDWWNVIPRLFGFELRAVRLEAMLTLETAHNATKAAAASSNSASKDEKLGKENKSKKNNNADKTKNNDGPSSSSSTSADNIANLQAISLECDRIATKRLGAVFLPLVVLYAIYSLVYEEHTGWYSWFITSASSAVYALGFVLMTPQLFLNYKLKSVAHLPWRVLIYKSLNTFIDDLFSFIIRMPTMARISCFRDDIVFFVYLYQRWLYPVDTSRPVEGGGDGTENDATSLETKKNQ